MLEDLEVVPSRQKSLLEECVLFVSMMRLSVKLNTWLTNKINHRYYQVLIIYPVSPQIDVNFIPAWL